MGRKTIPRRKPVRVIARQQWTPELAEEIARAQSVLFIDCSVDSAPGSIILTPVEPTTELQGIATHHQGAAELLALTRDLYSSQPTTAKLLTIGAGSTELGEQFSESVTAALPEACRLIEETVSASQKILNTRSSLLGNGRPRIAAGNGRPGIYQSCHN
jgi:hydrogenase maturation protease